VLYWGILLINLVNKQKIADANNLESLIDFFRALAYIILSTPPQKPDDASQMTPVPPHS
jgi:hypothetical protein